MKMTRQHQPCLNCKCGADKPSSDGYCEYEDGHGYCFPGKHYFHAEGEDLKDFTLEYVAMRGITQETMRFYDTKTRINSDGEPIQVDYTYANGAAVYRPLTGDKRFPSQGDIQNAGLWGKERFPPGSAKSITVTEGREDAMSVFQMLGSRYPSVSVQSSVVAARDCRIDRDHLNSFERIYICFEDDAPGRKAAQEVATLFDFNKVYRVKLPGVEDANAMLQGGMADQFLKMWHNAKRFQPEDIHSTLSDFDDIIDRAGDNPGFPYPFACLQEATGGIRRGEVTLITSQRGVGKSALVHAIEYKLLKDVPEIIIGAVHLEETRDIALKHLATLELHVPCHIPNSPVPKDDIKAAYRRVIFSDGRYNLYSHWGSDDPDLILDKIRYMVAVLGCNLVILDVLTLVVTGLRVDDERKALDYISTRGAIMAEELNFAFVVTSHENKEGDARGSSNIANVAHTWIKLFRDPMNTNDFLKRLTTVTLPKNRPMAITGEVGKLLFQHDTHSLSDYREKDLPV